MRRKGDVLSLGMAIMVVAPAKRRAVVESLMMDLRNSFGQGKSVVVLDVEELGA